jgi:hypothetical protein
MGIPLMRVPVLPEFAGIEVPVSHAKAGTLTGTEKLRAVSDIFFVQLDIIFVIFKGEQAHSVFLYLPAVLRIRIRNPVLF